MSKMKFISDGPKGVELELSPEFVAGFEKDLGLTTMVGEPGVLVDLDPAEYKAYRVWIPKCRIEEAKKLLEKGNEE